MHKPAPEIPMFQRFGKLTAMGSLKKWNDLGRLETKALYVLVVCDCGRSKFVTASALRNGATISCGCARAAKDRVGERFGKLLVIERTTAPPGRRPNDCYWRCKCDCGNKTVAETSALTSGNTKSCGCAKAAEDRTGQRFGKLVIIGRAEKPSTRRKENSSAFWRCRCDCGNETVVDTYSLTTGNTTSCGCLFDAIRKASTLHGLRGTRVINVWKNMIARCTDPDQRDYPRYGGRGITVCDRWLNGEHGKHPALCFFEDMGHPPPKFTIDRIDVNGNYEPGNVRWADKRTQVKNRRITKWVKVLGVSMTLAECARQFKVEYERFRYRVVTKGEAPEEALRRLGVRISEALEAADAA